MSMDNHKIHNTLKLRENMNIDRRERKDAPVVWAIIIICVVTFGYLTVFDSRFQDVPVKGARK
ncbi:MAG: hypothetical protein WAW75_04935 [Gallionella sp.]